MPENLGLFTADNELYYKVVETSNDAIFLADPDTGIILYANKKAEEVIGRPKNELIGIHQTELHAEEDKEHCRKLFQMVACQERITLSGEQNIYLCHKDGHKIPVSLSASLIDISGKKIVQGVFRDITVTKQFEDAIKFSEARYRELFNNIKSAVAVYEAIDDGDDFVFRDCNNTLEQIEDINKQDIIGKPVTKVFPSVKDFGLLDILKRVWQTGAPEYMPPSLYADKRVVGWRENHIYKLPSGEIVAVYDDVSEYKRVEEDLIKAREDLEIRVQKRTMELAKTNVELQEEINLRKDIDTKLSILNKQMEFVLGATKTGLDIIDEDYNMVYIDAEWAKVYGDYKGKKCYKYFMDRDEVCPGCGVTKALKTKQPIITEEVLVKEANRPIQVTTLPYCDKQGRWFVAEVNVDISERKKIENALINNEERYHNIVLTMTDYIYSVHLKNGRSMETQYGPGCFKVTGYTQEEFNSLPYLWIDMVYEEDQAKVQDWSSRILKGEKVGPIEHRIIRKDGYARWIRNTPVFKYNDAGKLISYDGVVQDITDKKDAEIAKAKAETITDIVNNMPDAVIVTDLNGKIAQYNNALVEIFNIKKQVVNKPICDLFVKEDKDIIEDQIKICKDKRYVKNIETRIDCKDEKDKRYVLLNIKLLTISEKINNFICVITDITELKKIEEIKNEFINTVSHELRTPLAAIKGGIDIVLDGTAGALQAKQGKFLHLAKSNVDRLSRFINNVLDYQKLQSGNIDFKFTKEDINLIAKEASSSMSFLAKKKRIKLKLDLDKNLPKINIDKDKIIQVLNNLVNNAIKFTVKGSITISTFKKANNLIGVSVEDTGIGIKSPDLKKLFLSFSQVTPRKYKAKDSTGLGLAISRAIINRCGGRIWAESKYGLGSTFYFVLPLNNQGGGEK